MAYTTLIATAELADHLDDHTWAVVDCRFSLDDPERGRQAYRQAHIPGAVYAHLNEDLSGPIVPGRTGRHPLPDVETVAHTFGRWGIDAHIQVVAYDDLNGSMAARLWWMLRWLGHTAVAVLDGGWDHWLRTGRPVRSGEETHAPKQFAPHPRSELVVAAADVEMRLHAPDVRLVDARAVERYRGETEPLDPVAGHIPGAVCSPFTQNLRSDGRFLPPDELRAHFQHVLGEVAPDRTIFYCGSGVTAAHNLLALSHAGLGDARLYAGSWSDWITDPERPVERG